ncbi:MAG: DUF3575 domain-containing protein [Bacteroidales bacterium]|nr:DUF3575 domain-containing protein [Bacteroidales bacterium]
MNAKSNTYKVKEAVDYFHAYDYTSPYYNVEESYDMGAGPKDKKKIKKKKDVGNKTKDRRSSYFSKRYKTNRKRRSSNIDKKTFAIKTNLVYSAALTPNLAVEIPIKEHFSAEASTTYNAWDLEDNIKWKNLTLTAEFRYWPKKNMEGQFFGINANWAKYNIGGIKMPYFADAIYYRYDGWMSSVGLSYGYMFNLSRSWSFEANIGVGLSYTSYDKYLHPVCGAYWGSYKNILFMPTKIGLSFVYKFN